MRLIDADELMESIRKALGIKSMAKSFLLPAERTIIDQIDSAQTVGGWISVKDRLPDLGQEVLVYAVGKIDGFIGEHVYALCNRFVLRLFPSSPGYERWSSPWEYFHTDYEITHWMPLPEKPEEEAEDDD